MIATQTTWGLSGPSFLWLYGGLCVAVAVTIYWQWQRALGPRPSAESAQLDPYRLAMLNGGPQLAITAAAARLQTDGVLGSGDQPQALVVDGRLDRDADELEQAVFHAVEREPQIKTAALRRELERSEPVQQLASRLIDVGLLIKPEVSARLRRLWLLGAALLVLGAARIWAGITNDAPVGYLVIIVIAVAFATVWLSYQRAWATARGQALVARQRRAHSDLSSGGRGGSELPLAVALFGGAALWAAEPAIASTWSVPRENASTWTGGGGSCGGGFSGGGGADSAGGGGGGCGGGCGGGGS